MKITVTSNISGYNTYQSAKQITLGESVTIKARELSGYIFVKWSNGDTSNPLTLTPTEDVVIQAIYRKKLEMNGTYEWRCYIKEQTAMNTLPKALLRVLFFDIAEDLLATAKSSIDVLEVPEDVNIGDIVALYNPQGIVKYMGIIESIDDTTIKCSQMQSIYKGIWLKDNNSTKTTIETEFAYLLEQYAHGYMKGSTYQDTLQYQEKAPLKIGVGSSTSGNLTTPTKDHETVDMEKYIYQLYRDYQILLEFDIPYGAWAIGDANGGKTTIKKPNYTKMKIGDNCNAILEVKPTHETEQTNKLIVYGKDGSYRTTCFATTNGIVEEPATNVGRLEDINTKIVFSDDPLEDLISANLPLDLFNHKITFTLILNNNVYDYKDIKLGMPVDIYAEGKYYDSVITAYKMTLSQDENVTSIQYTCGFVRTELTKKLSMKLGVLND